VAHGIPPVVFDASGRAPVSGAQTLVMPPASGLTLAFAALPALQDLVVSAAADRLPDAGIPRRSKKVASAEPA
jgi:hypothetical protein